VGVLHSVCDAALPDAGKVWGGSTSKREQLERLSVDHSQSG
jgi:hypothetical protein